jgi:hypothetical protein
MGNSHLFRIRSSDKELILLADCYHVIRVHRQRDAAAREVIRVIHFHFSLGGKFELPASRSEEAL